MRNYALLYELIYTSVASWTLNRDEFDDLLHQARVRNGTLDVTGVLIAEEGGFLQLLEGGRDDVEAVFRSIEKDRRHHTLKVYYSGETEARSFEKWSMAFRPVGPGESLDEWTDGLRGYTIHVPDRPGRTLGRRLLKLLHVQGGL